MNDVMLYNANGQRIVAEKTKSVYALDPNFWTADGTGLGTNAAAREPYKWHYWIYACVRSITNNIANLPRVVYRTDDPDKYIEDHEILDLFNGPNLFMSGSDLWETMLQYLLLPTTSTPGGQCFLIGESGKKGVFTNFAKGEIPWEMYCFSDEVIRAVKSPTGWITGWEFRIAGNKLHVFSHEEIIRIRFINPYQPEYGLSPYSAARIAVYNDIKADEWNSKVYDNDGRVAGVLKSEQPIGVDEMKSILKSWRDQYQGGGNHDKIAMLPHGLEYEQFMRNNMEMQFVQMKKLDKEVVMGTYGVPETELAVYSSGMNRATAEQADRNYWQKTLLPIESKIWATLNARWISKTEKGKLRGCSDLSTVPALQEDVKGKADTAKVFYDMGVPSAECLRAVDAPVQWEKYPHLEHTLVNPLLVDADKLVNGEIEPPPAAPAPAKEPDENPEENPEKIVRVRRIIDSPARDAIWKAYVERVLDPQEAAFKKWFSERYLVKQRNGVLDQIDAWAKENAGQTLGKTLRCITIKSEADLLHECGMCISDSRKFAYVGKKGVALLLPAEAGVVKAVKVDADMFLFDVETETESLEKGYKPFASASMKASAAQVKAEIGARFDWAYTDDKLESVINARADYLKSINETTFAGLEDRVSEVIMDGMESNASVQQVAQALKETVIDEYDLRRSNAQTIARTEMGSVANDTRNDAFIDSGIKRHEWLSARDELVRVSHADEDGHVVEIGEAFPSTGLEYPQEPGGEAGEVINCRCVALAILEE